MCNRKTYKYRIQNSSNTYLEKQSKVLREKETKGEEKEEGRKEVREREGGKERFEK